MNYRQRLYLRTTIVLLFFPFDRPLLRWLHARSLRRSEALWLALYPVEIVAAVEGKRAPLQNVKHARLERIKDERRCRTDAEIAKAKRDDNREKTPREFQEHRSFNYFDARGIETGSTLTLSSPLLPCPICDEGQIETKMEHTIDGYRARFWCLSCSHQSVLMLERGEFRPSRIERVVSDHLKQAWFNHSMATCESLACASSIATPGRRMPNLVLDPTTLEVV